MTDDEQKDVTIGVPAASAGAEPVGEEDTAPPSTEDEDEEK